MAGIMDVFKGKGDDRIGASAVVAMAGEVTGNRPGSAPTNNNRRNGVNVDSPAASYARERAAAARAQIEARKAMEGWIALILKTQAEGDFEFASQYSKDNGTIKSDLQADLDRINKSGIPRDIRFNQGLDVLGLK